MECSPELLHVYLVNAIAKVGGQLYDIEFSNGSSSIVVDSTSGALKLNHVPGRLSAVRCIYEGVKFRVNHLAYGRFLTEEVTGGCLCITQASERLNVELVTALESLSQEVHAITDKRR